MRIAYRLWLLSASWFHAAAAVGAEPPDHPSSIAKTRDQLFQEVFKRSPPPIPVDSYLVVVIDGSVRQKLRATQAPDGRNVFLDGKPLTALLSQLLRPELVRQLEQRIDSQGFLDRVALEQAGLSTAFEPRAFEFSLTTSPETRAPGTVYLSPPLPDPFAVEAIRPASVSGFLNFNLKGVDRNSLLTDASLDSQELGVALDGAVNIEGVVLEGSAFGQTSETDSLQRGDVRLVYDWPQRALRFMAGDLDHPVLGYQSPRPIGGLGMSTDFSLQPQVRTYWSGDFTFELERPAEVKIFMNESLISTRQLPAGVHDLRRFTPAVGQNDIDVVIDDRAGRREVLHFSFIHDPTLLEKGLSLYSWNVGFAREFDGGDYRYDTSRPVFSGSYLRGVTDSTTLGGYAEALEERSLLGVQALRTLSIGTLQLNSAVSRTREGQWDGAAKIALTTRSTWNGPQSHLSVEYLGRHFNASDAFSYRAREALNFQASLAVPLQQGWTGRLSANYLSARRSDERDVYGAAATLHRRWNRYVTGSLSVRHGQTLIGEADTEVLFGLNVNFTNATGSYSASKELESDRVNAQWNSRRSRSVSTPYGFALARTGPDLREYQGGAGYWGNQGLAEASYLRSEIEYPSGRELREEATVRLQSSLVFADGTFALAQPVIENFAIVTGKEGLEDVAMKVDPDSRGNSRARSAWWTPAAITDLSSYRLSDVRIEPVDPPLGATPEKMTFQLAPTYKSGVLLKVGKELRIVAVGRLVDDLGAPIAHLPIEIRRADRPDAPAVATFTGKNGNFQAPDLTPGKYQIRPNGGRWGTVTVNIPETPDGIRRLGDVVAPPAM